MRWGTKTPGYSKSSRQSWFSEGIKTARPVTIQTVYQLLPQKQQLKLLGLSGYWLQPYYLVGIILKHVYEIKRKSREFRWIGRPRRSLIYLKNAVRMFKRGPQRRRTPNINGSTYTQESLQQQCGLKHHRTPRFTRAGFTLWSSHCLRTCTNQWKGSGILGGPMKYRTTDRKYTDCT